MKEVNDKVECPNCGEVFDAESVMLHKIDEENKKKYMQKLAAEKAKFSEEESKLAEERKKLDQEKQQQKVTIDKEVAKLTKQKETELTKILRSKLEEEQADAFDSLNEELNEKNKKLKNLNKTTVELEKTKRKMDELEESIKAQAEIELSHKLSEERKKIHKLEQQKNELKFKELEKQLEDQKKLTEEMKRKQEQGSMQTQGEVQELAIEEWLKEKFPLDEIEEIKKGQTGADCLQTVNTRTRQNCGTIYYESKRTKTFQKSWIQKFKSDIKDRNADIGVLVTDVMPKELERLDQIDEIWVCTYDEFKSLCTVLRESIIRTSKAFTIQQNKGDKQAMLYDYLTSNEFKQQIMANVDTFMEMKKDLDAEKRKMLSTWKKREKQIELIQTNTIDAYSSIKGIGGDSIQSTPLLELDTED